MLHANFLKWNKLNCIPCRHADVRPGPPRIRSRKAGEDRHKMENPPSITLGGLQINNVNYDLYCKHLFKHCLN